MISRAQRPVAVLLAAGAVGILAVVALVSNEGAGARTVLDIHDANNPIPVNVGRWQTDNAYQWCGDDPDCGYGNVALNKEEAYADPSPLAIINEDYKEGQLNPFPGPVNFGPDSPMSWAPEEEMPDLPGMVAKVWPEYTGSPNSRVNQEKSPVQLLRMVRRPFQGQLRLQSAANGAMLAEDAAFAPWQESSWSPRATQGLDAQGQDWFDQPGAFVGGGYVG